MSNLFKKQTTLYYIMPKGESEMDYNNRTLQSIIFDQASRYFKFTKAHTERVFDKETADLACKVGYTLNIASGIHKTFKQEKRLKALEEKLKSSNLSLPMRMFEEPQLEKYR